MDKDDNRMGQGQIRDALTLSCPLLSNSIEWRHITFGGRKLYIYMRVQVGKDSLGRVYNCASIHLLNK